MDYYRTPDDRFADLPGYAYEPRYMEGLIPGAELRMHWIEDGPADGEVALCLHGNPSWCYLYRKMIPVFAAAGMRCVAPDLFGFGRSDKPTDDAAHSFSLHRDSLIAFIERLDLKRITLVCQDWGGLLGLTLPMDMPGRFERLLIMNTGLATGDIPMGEGFEAWRAYNRSQPDLAVGRLIARGTPPMSAEEAAAYDAPFPEPRAKAAVRRMPDIVPSGPDDDGAAIARRAREYLSKAWDGTSFMAIGVQDPVLGRPAMELLRGVVRGCPEPLLVDDGGHFLQEWGVPVARAALASFGLGEGK